VHRIYLEELGQMRALPLWVALMVLTTLEPEAAPAEARHLLERSRTEASEEVRGAIIEMVTTVMAYRFERLSQREIEAMLDITLKETQVYQEIKEEGRQEGRQEATAALVIRLVTKRFGSSAQAVQPAIAKLSLPELERLSEALLDFASLSDLQVWLAEH
jgi:predicted transposase YdaD